MNYEESQKELKIWISEIEERYTKDPQGTLEYCERLEQYAETVRSDRLKGYCLFFKGQCKYLLNDLDKGYECLSLALNHLIQTEQWELVARDYNSLGIISDSCGDQTLAVDYFFKGLKICRENDLSKPNYYINSNIANIYMALGELSNAVLCLKECERMIQCGYEFWDEEKIAVYFNLTTCYTRMNRLELAESYLKCAETTIALNRSETHTTLISFLWAALFNAKGEIGKRDEVIERLKALDLSRVVLYNIFDELFDYADMLLNVEKYDELLSLLRKIEVCATSPNALKKIIRLRTRYYKKIGDQQSYMNEAARYCEAVEAMEKQQNQSTSRNIAVRVSLEREAERREKAEKANQMLRQRSEVDALTGISNRYKLNEVSEAAFQKAYLNGTTLGVELLDVDFYKEFNDNYGHQAGDECLVRIAEAICSMERYAGVHTGRYGGDEFMVIYEGYGRDEIQRMAEELRTRIARLHICHGFSEAAAQVTISQGIFLKTPEGNNKLWDFLYAADSALYIAKKRKGRDAYHIITSREEMNADIFSIGEKSSK